MSQLLDLRGIDNIVLEKHSRDYVLGRIRAGVLEHGFAELMREAKCGERMDAEGEILNREVGRSLSGMNAAVDYHEIKKKIAAGTSGLEAKLF